MPCRHSLSFTPRKGSTGSHKRRLRRAAEYDEDDKDFLKPCRRCGYYGHHPAFCESPELLDAAYYHVLWYEGAIEWYEGFLRRNGEDKAHHAMLANVYTTMTRLMDTGLEVLKGGPPDPMRLEHACQIFDRKDFQKHIAVDPRYDPNDGGSWQTTTALRLWHEADVLVEDVLGWVRLGPCSPGVGQLEDEARVIQQDWEDWKEAVDDAEDFHLNLLEQVAESKDRVEKLLSELAVKIEKMTLRGMRELSSGAAGRNACKVQ